MATEKQIKAAEERLAEREERLKKAAEKLVTEAKFAEIALTMPVEVAAYAKASEAKLLKAKAKEAARARAAKKARAEARVAAKKAKIAARFQSYADAKTPGTSLASNPDAEIKPHSPSPSDSGD